MGALNSLLKTGSKALTTTGAKTVEKAVEKATESAVKKVASKAISNAAQKTATSAIRKALTTGGVSKSASALSKLYNGAELSGVSSKLGTKSGSALEGVLGPSSGVKLPQAKKKTLKDYGETVGSLVGDDLNASDLYEAGVNLKTVRKIQNAAKEGASLKRDAFEAQNAYGATSKSELPKLNREQYYKDTIGSVRNGSMSYADVPEYMNSHLSNPKNTQEAFTRGGNDEILRNFFNDNESSLDELYDRYDKLAQSENANRTFTGDNIETGLALGDEKTKKEIEQEVADAIFGNKKSIKVSGGSSGTKKINVNRPSADLGESSTITDTASAGDNSEEALREEIENLRSKIGGGGTAGNGGSGNIGGGATMSSPEDDGFKIKLKNGETTNVQLQNSATGSSKQQRAFRKLDDMTAKGMNSSSKQYQNVVGKSGSIDSHYKSVAERMRAEKIDQANVAEKASSALAGREDIKQQGLQYAEKNGVTINLSGVDNTIGLSTAQKRKLDELGLGLNNMLGDWSGAVSPTEAENIYKTLRDYAYNWSDSKDALTKMAGSACEKEAKAVREAIDQTMDNINVDYKTPLVEFMTSNGEDPAYIRKVAGKSDFKFSDLRKDQSDWITINELSGNKIKDNPTINILGVDTGVENPFTSFAGKAKEKIYEKQAYGKSGGAGGAGGSGVPPTGNAGAGSGASGAENNINFETAPAGQSKLQSLLSKGKNAGLVGAGVLGGLLLGGGSNDNPSSTSGTLGDMLNTQTQETVDPYSTYTIGGYTYDQLEQGYVAAITAGDTEAASTIKEMLDMLNDKIEKAEESSSSSTTNSAVNVLSELYSLYGDIKGGTGPIAGNITNALNSITGGGYNTEANTYWQVAQGALGKLIKGMGDTGALSEGDQQRALKMIPTITDTTEAAEAKFKALYQILSQASS